jgi:hypothetical protein
MQEGLQLRRHLMRTTRVNQIQTVQTSFLVVATVVQVTSAPFPEAQSSTAVVVVVALTQIATPRLQMVEAQQVVLTPAGAHLGDSAALQGRHRHRQPAERQAQAAAAGALTQRIQPGQQVEVELS